MTHEGVSSLIYEDVVNDEMVRVICRPYEGDVYEKAEYRIETQRRKDDTEEWRTVVTHWAKDRPRIAET